MMERPQLVGALNGVRNIPLAGGPVDSRGPASNWARLFACPLVCGRPSSAGKQGGARAR